MPFDLQLLKINLKHHPHAYKLARRLLLHHNMNFSKTNANVISVKILLESTNIPTYEQIKNKGRQIRQKIINPLESEMNYLQQINFLQWNYTTDIDYSYQKWIDSSIHFKIFNYPSREKSIKS